MVFSWSCSGVIDINTLIKFDDATASSIKAVFVVFDKPPYAVIARQLRHRDAQGPRRQEARRPRNHGQFRAMADLRQGQRHRYRQGRGRKVGVPVREPMLASGEVDAVTGCAFIFYIDLKDHGVPRTSLALLPMADYGVALYGDAIIVAPKFVADKPDAVQEFLRAYVKALKETVRDPAGAIEAVLRRNDAPTGISSSNACAWRSPTTS